MIELNCVIFYLKRKRFRNLVGTSRNCGIASRTIAWRQSHGDSRVLEHRAKFIGWREYDRDAYCGIEVHRETRWVRTNIILSTKGCRVAEKRAGWASVRCWCRPCFPSGPNSTCVPSAKIRGAGYESPSMPPRDNNRPRSLISPPSCNCSALTCRISLVICATLVSHRRKINSAQPISSRNLH